jgi:hypothetical protein
MFFHVCVSISKKILSNYNTEINDYKYFLKSQYPQNKKHFKTDHQHKITTPTIRDLTNITKKAQKNSEL